MGGDLACRTIRSGDGEVIISLGHDKRQRRRQHGRLIGSRSLERSGQLVHDPLGIPV